MFYNSEFYDIAKDLPASLENSEQLDAANFQTNNEMDNNTVQIIGTHMLVPENSISRMLDAFASDESSTLIDIDVSYIKCPIL